MDYENVRVVEEIYQEDSDEGQASGWEGSEDGASDDDEPDNTIIKNKRAKSLVSLQKDIKDSIEKELAANHQPKWDDKRCTDKQKAIAAAFQKAVSESNGRLVAGWKYIPNMDWKHLENREAIKGLQELKNEGRRVTLEVDSAGAGGGAGSSSGRTSEPTDVILRRQRQSLNRVREEKDRKCAICYLCQDELKKNHGVNSPRHPRQV